MFLDSHVGSLIEPVSGRRWSRPEIIRQFHRRVAFYNGQGIGPFDRVFVHYGNKLEFFVDLLAIWTLGGCVIPIDSRLVAFEVETLARAATPRFSLWHETVDEGIARRLSAIDIKVVNTAEAVSGGNYDQVPSDLGNRISLDQDALILFTSGTTGQPKGVVHTHRSLRSRWMSLRDSLSLAKFRRTLCLLPTHFGHGLICNCLFPWLSGQELYIVPPFKNELLTQLGTLIDENNITFMSSVPSVWRFALKMAKPPQTRNLERVFCGSAPLSASLWKGIQEWTGTEEVLNAYGITETGSWVAGTTVSCFTPEDGLIGESWGAVIKILESKSTAAGPALAEEAAPGEAGYVWINTPALMKGYLGRNDLTNEVVSQGWFMTGDIGLFDERGFLYLRGRERDEINKGGMKVYPSDIDAVVERFEEAMDSCCFAHEDAFYGQDVSLAVVMKNSDQQAIRKLYDWLKQHLANHQMPVRWYLLDSIPRSSRGKINRTNVAEKCARLSPVNLRELLRKG